MKDILALVTIMLWPVIPLYWIPVHAAPDFFRRLGKFTFLIVFLVWAVVACVIYRNREFIMVRRTQIPVLISGAGWVLLSAGTLLHIWTAALLTFPGIAGIKEVMEPQKSNLADKGPFAVVRHPTYLAHTMMFLGIFLVTGVTAVGIQTLADFIIVNAVIIPLEEKELLQRLGEPYRKYMTIVPRMLPHIRQKK
jgi:protein-S-isoprenylcysteine O-methyltransferase Ste14